MVSVDVKHHVYLITNNALRNRLQTTITSKNCPRSSVLHAMPLCCLLSSKRGLQPSIAPGTRSSFEFSVALRPQRLYGLSLGTGSPGRPSRLSHSSCALTMCCCCCFFKFCLMSVQTIRDREPRMATSTFTQLLS